MAVAKSNRKPRSKQEWGEAALDLLYLFEKNGAMTTDMAIMQLGLLTDKEPYSKLIDRERETLGCMLKGSRNYELNPQHPEYYLQLSKVLKHCYDKSDAMRATQYGDIDIRKLATTTRKLRKPATLIRDLSQAMIHSNAISFDYIPQTDITRQKLPAQKDRFRVTLVPHRLVYSADKLLLLGEWHGKKVIRQYDLLGIRKLKVLGVAQRLTSIDPHELYRHSFDIWLGSRTYELTLETMASTTDEPANVEPLSIKTNGEKEILSYLASKLGEVKLVDPPAAIQKAAKHYGLPFDMVFKFTG